MSAAAAVRMIRQVMFTKPDGTQSLLDIWSDGTYSLAERFTEGGVWGPPIDGVDASTRRRPRGRSD